MGAGPAGALANAPALRAASGLGVGALQQLAAGAHLPLMVSQSVAQCEAKRRHQHYCHRLHFLSHPRASHFHLSYLNFRLIAVAGQRRRSRCRAAELAGAALKARVGSSRSDALAAIRAVFAVLDARLFHVAPQLSRASCRRIGFLSPDTFELLDLSSLPGLCVRASYRLECTYVYVAATPHRISRLSFNNLIKAPVHCNSTFNIQFYALSISSYSVCDSCASLPKTYE